MRKKVWVIVMITSASLLLQAVAEPSESPEAFVRRLYKEYLATFEKDYWFDNEGKLSEYFDHNLSSLFLKDEECKKKEQGICNLDFDPIIAAQDYDDKIYPTLRVEKVRPAMPNRVKVTFTNLGRPTTLIYELKQMRTGWKVSNINYPQIHSSLVDILSQK